MNYKIVTKYIKDIDFNIPDPKTYFLIEKDQFQKMLLKFMVIPMSF